MIARALWIVLLFGIAGITAGVQIDRQARKTPALALYVPEIFRSASQPRVTGLAIDAGVGDLGVAEAQKLVRRRPIPARHLRLLAQAHFAAGDTEASGLAIQYAAQRGWREPLAQEAMMQIALVAGDRPEAARRYAALFLIRGTQQSLLEEAGPKVFPEAGGEERAVFAQIVRGGERWHSAFLSRGARVMPSDAFVEILEISADSGADFRCSALNQAQSTIAKKDAQLGMRVSAIVSARC